MWTLEQGLHFIDLVHPFAFEAGYNLSLTGSVLVNRQSEKDLDILAVRRLQVVEELNRDALIKIFYDENCIPINFRDLPYTHVVTLQSTMLGVGFKGKRIDLIIHDHLEVPEKNRKIFRKGNYKSWTKDPWSIAHLAKLYEARNKALSTSPK